MDNALQYDSLRNPRRAPSLFLNGQHEALKDLYRLNPDDCLRSIARMLREILNCETVCILLWNDGSQKLVTQYECGLPKNLDEPEQYGPREGVTGKIIFSEGRLVRCLVDISEHRIYDQQTSSYLDEGSTNWHNMEMFEHSSIHGFKHIMGAPLFVREQKLGAVKLINKLRDDGTLNDGGFAATDIDTLSYFLDAIEHVIEIKRNEQQVQSLLQIGQKIISAGSGFREILYNIASNCVDALNYRLCLIRLFEDERLTLRASNIGVHDFGDTVKGTPIAKAIQHKTPLKWKHKDQSSFSDMQLESSETRKKIRLTKVGRAFIEFIREYDVSAFLIVPIVQRGTVLGTIECYTSLARDIPNAELNAIRMYVDALVISSIRDSQQVLLSRLIEMQRINAISDDVGGEEDRVIKNILNHTKALLGQRLKVVAVIFSKQRLARSTLRCQEIYGAREKVLRSLIGKAELERIIGGSSRQNVRSRDYAISNQKVIMHERSDLEIIEIEIRPQQKGPPLGVLLIGVKRSDRVDSFTQDVAQLAADCLAVMLANIEEFRRSRALPSIIRDAARAASHDEIYDFILDQTITFFGFDFGAISRVDHINRVIETVSTRTAKPTLVEPEKWKNLSRYALESNDILSWVQREKQSVIINATTDVGTRDDRLNEYIYTTFKHHELARVWVPFIFRKLGPLSPHPDDLVLGVIEAGYHRSKSDFVDKRNSDLFTLFVDNCANSLQRITLLDERKSVDDIAKRFNEEMNAENQERKPERILQKLLQETIDLVAADWGDITFLTHYDDKIHFEDDTISYRLPSISPRKFIRELAVGEIGRTGIVGYVAWSGKPYFSNDVKNDNKYLEESPDVNSELAVPLRFSGRVIGVLDINSNKKNWFDERKANLVQAVADHGTGLYQQARVVEPLYKLISPFNPFAGPSEIYGRVIELIEGFLSTETVSVWTRVPRSNKGSFFLKLAAASRDLLEKYRQAGITELPADCFTGRAATGNVIQVNEEQIKTEFITREFAQDNSLRSMTAVPISVGSEFYGAIDVFSRRNVKFFAEEVAILQVLASKAAIALQSAALIQSFNEIASIPPGDDIKAVLEGICKSALERLNADPVVLFRYDAETQQLDQDAITAGTFNYPEVRMITTKNKMAKMILELKESLYLKSQPDYTNFVASVNLTWHSNRFKEDFWHREQIKSLGALKLEHGGELVGMMFINFREPQAFPDYQKRLMEVFAAQAASVIYNARTWERNNRYWDMQRADSLSLSVSEIVSSLAHNSGNLIASINQRYGRLQRFISKTNADVIPKDKVKELVGKLDEPLDELTEDFNRLKDYRRFDSLNMQPCDVNALIRQSLQMLRVKFDNQRITVNDKNLANEIPLVECDRNQIQHVLLNLFLNATEAMGNKGTLSIATKVLTDSKPPRLQIRITDTGSGIKPDHKDKIFTTQFSTKKMKEGSGMGLPISEHIVTKHGGTIEFTTKPGKGTSFFVYLPIST